jgi:hypothetical protein
MQHQQVSFREDAAKDDSKGQRSSARDLKRQASTAQMNEIWQQVLPMLPNSDRTNVKPFFVRSRAKIDVEDAYQLFHLFDEVSVSFRLFFVFLFFLISLSAEYGPNDGS